MENMLRVLLGAGLLASVALAENTKPLDNLHDNLFVDGELRLSSDTKPGAAAKIFLKTPSYWLLKETDAKTSKVLRDLDGTKELPFDREVKAVGDASLRLDGTGNRIMLSRRGYSETRYLVYHGWGYRTSCKLKLKDVVGQVQLQVDYSWGKQLSQPLSGTLDWTEVPLEFVFDKGTNTFQGLSVIFEGTGTVWVDDFQLHMRHPEAFEWWRQWNGHPQTAPLSEVAGTDEKAGVLPPKPAPLELDKFGGLKALKSTQAAAGFFRVEKINGKWWLITPEGHGFFKTAMFVPEYPSYRDKDAVLQAVGLQAGWSIQTWKRLKSWDFNAIEWGPGYFMTMARGAKVPPELVGAQLPYTSNARFEMCTDPARNGGIVVPVVDWGWKTFPDVFSAQFAKAVENYGTPTLEGKQYKPAKGSHFVPRPDDPYMIGYLLADEPPWYGPAVWYGSLSDGFHGLPDSYAGKQKWLEFLKGRYAGEISKLNQAWVASFPSWEELAKTKSLPRNSASVNDRRDFMGLIAERWYDLIAAQIKKYDTNHMMLGGNATRLYPTVYAAEAKNVDVLCASLYNLSGSYRPDPDFHYYIDQQVTAWTKKPIMVGYLAGQLDGGGMPNLSNQVDNGKLRGQSYSWFLQQLAANENVVGVFWWMYQSWAEPSIEGYAKNWGIVTHDNRVYLDLLPFVQRANSNIYHYRTGQTPAQPEVPTQWSPSSGFWVAPSVTFQLKPLPYPVDKYEIGLAPAESSDQLEVLATELKNGFWQAQKTLAPGKYLWKARTLSGATSSPWGEAFVLHVLTAAEQAALDEANKAINDGQLWKMQVTHNDGQDVKVNLVPNAQHAQGKTPLRVEVPQGQQIKKILLTAQLPKALLLKAGAPFSFRVQMLADLEAACVPRVGLGFKHGYKAMEVYAPIDKGWLVQRSLSGNKITHVRTSVRLPREMEVSDLQVELHSLQGNVQIVSLELVPEPEYDVPLSLMDDFEAIAREFDTLPRK